MTNDVGLVGDKYDGKVGGYFGRRQIVEEVAGDVVRFTVNDRVYYDERVWTLRIFYGQLHDILSFRFIIYYAGCVQR